MSGAAFEAAQQQVSAALAMVGSELTELAARLEEERQRAQRLEEALRLQLEPGPFVFDGQERCGAHRRVVKRHMGLDAWCLFAPHEGPHAFDAEDLRPGVCICPPGRHPAYPACPVF